MITRRKLLKLSLGVSAMVTPAFNFANANILDSNSWDSNFLVDCNEIKTTLKYNDKIDLIRLYKSFRKGLETKSIFKNEKKTITLNFNFMEMFTETKLSGDYTITVISEDFYSSFRRKDDIFITDKPNFSFKTTIPEINKIKGNGNIKSSFYILISKEDKLSVIRLSLDPVFIINNTHNKNVLLSKKRNVLSRLNFDLDDDVLFTPKVINGNNVLNINVLVED